jgi:ATP-binding cassette subfamily B protein
MDTQEIQSLAGFLASVDLLSALTPVEIERLAESAESRLLAFGDTVCNAGDVAEGLFIVRSGSIRVFAADGDKEISLGVRKAGEVFGEIVMLRESRHEWSARASGKTELLFIPRGVIGPIVAVNSAARALVASRGRIDQSPVRPPEQGRPRRTGRTVAKRGRQAGRRRRGNPEAGLDGRSPLVCRAPR